MKPIARPASSRMDALSGVRASGISRRRVTGGSRNSGGYGGCGTRRLAAEGLEEVLHVGFAAKLRCNFGEYAAQVLTGPGHPALDGAEVDAEGLANLLVGEVLQVAHAEDVAVRRIELFQTLGDDLDEFVADREAERARL